MPISNKQKSSNIQLHLWTIKSFITVSSKTNILIKHRNDLLRFGHAITELFIYLPFTVVYKLRMPLIDCHTVLSKTFYEIPDISTDILGPEKRNLLKKTFFVKI